MPSRIGQFQLRESLTLSRSLSTASSDEDSTACLFPLTSLRRRGDGFSSSSEAECCRFRIRCLRAGMLVFVLFCREISWSDSSIDFALGFLGSNLIPPRPSSSLSSSESCKSGTRCRGAADRLLWDTGFWELEPGFLENWRRLRRVACLNGRFVFLGGIS